MIVIPSADWPPWMSASIHVLSYVVTDGGQEIKRVYETRVLDELGSTSALP